MIFNLIIKFVYLLFSFNSLDQVMVESVTLLLLKECLGVIDWYVMLGGA